MRVVINLGKAAGSRHLVEVLQAVETHRATRRSHVEPSAIVVAMVSRGINLGLDQLEQVSDRISGWLLNHIEKSWQKLKNAWKTRYRLVLG
jgi:hypothetical protein